MIILMISQICEFEMFLYIYSKVCCTEVPSKLSFTLMLFKLALLLAFAVA